MPEGGRLGWLCESCQNPQTVMIICQDLLCDKNAYLCRFKSQSLSFCQHISLPISDVSAVNSHFLLIVLASRVTFWTQMCSMFWSEWASNSSEKAVASFEVSASTPQSKKVAGLIPALRWTVNLSRVQPHLCSKTTVTDSSVPPATLRAGEAVIELGRVDGCYWSPDFHVLNENMAYCV